ncbi:MAG: hypothetical protein ACTHOU_06215 [Aureliella sp.]
MRSFETNDQTYEIPPVTHDVLQIEHADGKVQSFTAGQVKRVKVPAGGVTIRFMSGGGKEMHEAIRLVYKQPPKPAKKPEVVAGPPPLTLLKDEDDSDKPTQVELVSPPPPVPPKGESVQVSDQADPAVDKK